MSEHRVTDRPEKRVHAITTQDGKAVASNSAPDFFIKDDPSNPAPKGGPAFSMPLPGNQVEFYTTGQAYFEAVAAAIEGAQECVFITGWQVNFDVMLSGKKRLFDCLAKAVDAGKSVYVMPWLSPKVGVNTFDLETMLAVFQLNAGRSGPPKAFALPAMAQSDQGMLGFGFSHHQKLVVIDNKIAFVGGIDLAYGRRDDARYSLKADGREGCELYNPCIPPLKEIQPEKQAEYLTRAELLDACFNIGTMIAQSKKRAMANVKDKLGVDELREWWNEETAFTLWLNKRTQALREPAQGAAIDSAAWAFDKLPQDTKRALAQYTVTGASTISHVSGALFSWLNNRSLDGLPQGARSSAEVALMALSTACYRALSFSADSMPIRYPYLTGGRTMLPKDAKTIDPATQPRMPWHDVQAKIEGASVYDLANNFVRRWNSVQHRINPVLPAASPASGDGALRSLLQTLGIAGRAIYKPQWIPAEHLPKRIPPKPGACTVQVLRSAPSRLRTDEENAIDRQSGLQSRSQSRSFALQDNCKRAMVLLIGSAQHFVYIEGQFFQSDHGNFAGHDPQVFSGPMGYLVDFSGIPGFRKYEKLLNLREASHSQNPEQVIHWHKIPTILKDKEFPEFIEGLKRVIENKAAIKGFNAIKTPQTKLLNKVGQALAERIERAINKSEPFHVYMLLPVHPEGMLNIFTIMTQVHLTMQSLVFGEKSLVNRIRRSIKTKELMQKDKLSLKAAREKAEEKDAQGKALFEYVTDAQWQQYLTPLNLRAWDTLGGKPVTEQVYIHSKLLIADDCTAILGSANINDRSLEGDRDSELAVIVHDGDSVSIPMDGKRSFQVSKSVHKLRADLWKKHFGITGGVNPATELADCIDKPADPQTWKKIQLRASDNARAYEKSFMHIPRDESSVQATKTPASIWPTWSYPEPPPGQPVIKVGGIKQGLMPFEPAFWGKDGKTAQAPVGVKGFITALPLQWTGSENNNSGFHLTMLAGLLPEGGIQVAAASTPSVATG